MISLNNLRQYALTRSLFAPTSLGDAIERLGFVQIDPIQAPAKAHDLILRHRVTEYRQGDIERAYPELPLEEAYFINHGYLPRAMANAFWCNKPVSDYLNGRATQVEQILQFAQTQSEINGKLLNQYFDNATVTNAWGGSSQEGTHIIQRMHSSGLLRIVRRQKGTRVYGLPLVQQHETTPQDIVIAALNTLAKTYAPFTKKSLTYMARLFLHGRADLKDAFKQALNQLETHFASAQVDGQRWYWPLDENLNDYCESDERLRLLSPFDPVVWDRDRFQQFWGWEYKFEAYKPVRERQYGYYALPVLWLGECVGWANVTATGTELGYVNGKPKGKAFQTALNQELTKFNMFLNEK